MKGCKTLAVLVGLAVAVIATSDASAYYHPRVARFCQRDPIGYADGMSLYEYVGSSPIYTRDSLGLLKCTENYFLLLMDTLGDVWTKQRKAGEYSWAAGKLKYNIHGFATEGFISVLDDRVVKDAVKEGWRVGSKFAAMHPWLAPIVEGVNLLEILAENDTEGLREWAYGKVASKFFDYAKANVPKKSKKDIKAAEDVSKLMWTTMKKDLSRIFGGPYTIHHNGPIRMIGNAPSSRKCQSEVTMVSAEWQANNKVSVVIQGYWYDKATDCCCIFAVGLKTTGSRIKKHTDLKPKISYKCNNKITNKKK